MIMSLQLDMMILTMNFIPSMAYLEGGGTNVPMVKNPAYFEPGGTNVPMVNNPA